MHGSTLVGLRYEPLSDMPTSDFSMTYATLWQIVRNGMGFACFP
jgi:hypothetical protein